MCFCIWNILHIFCFSKLYVFVNSTLIFYGAAVLSTKICTTKEASSNDYGSTRPFFLVLARDKKHVQEKIEELDRLGALYLIVCGDKINHPNVVYRKPAGKFDAINFGYLLIPEYAQIIVLNDVDTKIINLNAALNQLKSKSVALVFSKVVVYSGPQQIFYGLLDAIRRTVPIAASGELMIIKRDVLEKTLPLKPCKAEDTYILFKILEMKYRAVFCETCYVETERTKTAENEENYKRKTVTGIYQALSYTNPPKSIKFFYFFLPFVSPLLLVSGKKGLFWMKGILRGLADYLNGDKTGIWETNYMD